MLKEIRFNTTGNIQIIRPMWKAEPQNTQESLTETIRRLRIQNKKLLNLVTHLKTELKNRTAEKNKGVEQIRELDKINNALAGIFIGCYQCNGKVFGCANCKESSQPEKFPNPQKFNLNILHTLKELITYNNDK